MPTLFRLLITVLFLGGLAYAGMFALVAFVQPEPKTVNVRIPTRDLLGEPETNRPPGLPTPNLTSTPSDGASGQ